MQNSPATSDLLSAMWPDSPLMLTKVHDLCAFQTQFDVDIFGGCESNLNWKHMPPLANSMSGSTITTYSLPSLATTPTMTLANDNMVEPSFWEMVRLPLPSLLPEWIPLVSDVGSGLPYLDVQESPHTSLVLTSPVTLLSSKLTVSILSTDPTS